MSNDLNLPWYVFVLGKNEAFIQTKDGSLLSGRLPIDVANYIVRCVNAHDGLVEALQLCNEALTWELGGEPIGSLCAEAQTKARSALAAATKEKP